MYVLIIQILLKHLWKKKNSLLFTKNKLMETKHIHFK